MRTDLILDESNSLGNIALVVLLFLWRAGSTLERHGQPTQFRRNLVLGGLTAPVPPSSELIFIYSKYHAIPASEDGHHLRIDYQVS
jgi:hypothetical protein